jgi:hypothetical protein
VQDPPVTYAEQLRDAIAALELACSRAAEALQRLNAFLREAFGSTVPLDDIPPDQR